MNLLKTFIGCLILNWVGWIVCTDLASTANSSNAQLAYLVFGYLLIFGADLIFLQKLYKEVI